MVNLPSLYHGTRSTGDLVAGRAVGVGSGLTQIEWIIILFVILGIIAAAVYYLSNRKKSSVIR